MKLSQLVKPWINYEALDCELADIKNNSRNIQPGDLFIAYPGAAADGRQFMQQAVAAGAVAVLYEAKNSPESFRLPTNVPCIPLENVANRLAAIAQHFYQYPSNSLKVTGVTGTNGKTTIAYQLAQAYTLLDQKAAYIGTLGQGEVHQLQALDNTTPDTLCLHGLLSEYLKRGIKQVCIEVSSHALSQGRVNGIEFSQAVFTNLTLDHLDYHHTMSAYAEAKAQLFAHEHLQSVIVNYDDPYSELMLQAVKPGVKKITYGFNSGSDVCIEQWHSDLQGSRMMVNSPWGRHELTIDALGQFNVSNCLAVFTSLMVNQCSVDRVVEVIGQLKAAPGRMELVALSPYVLVDYAHTPDALENVLTTLNLLKKGALWVIFGCGGDRDKTKRPIMGQVACLYADNVVVTSDNPRSEDPDQIIYEIVQGIPRARSIIKLPHREEAIAYALAHAAKEDIILIAGKGHEAYQQIGAKKQYFSDQEVVKNVLG